MKDQDDKKQQSLADRRQQIIDGLNQPNFMEKIKMEKEGLTWEQLKAKLKIPTYS